MKTCLLSYFCLCVEEVFTTKCIMWSTRSYEVIALQCFIFIFLFFLGLCSPMRSPYCVHIRKWGVRLGWHVVLKKNNLSVFAHFLQKIYRPLLHERFLSAVKKRIWGGSVCFAVLPWIKKVKGHIQVTIGELGYQLSSLVFTGRLVIRAQFTSAKRVISQFTGLLCTPKCTNIVEGSWILNPRDG